MARHRRVRVPGDRDMSKRLIEGIMQTSDVAYAEEWLSTTGSWCRCTS